MEQEHGTLNSPKPISYFYIALAVVITALAVGGIVFAVQTNEYNNTKISLQSQIDNLKSQLALKSTSSPSVFETANPTPSPTPSSSPLAQYSNATLGISLSYPTDWSSSTTLGGIVSLSSPETVTLMNTTSAPPDLSINYYASPGDLYKNGTNQASGAASLLSWLQASALTNGVGISQYSAVTINGYSGYIATYAPAAAGQGTCYYIENNGKVWQFIFGSSNKVSSDKILSTLHLT